MPEATILIAGFGLDRHDHVTLRAAAGEFGRDVQFVDVTLDMLGALADREWEDHYSLPIFGRLFLADAITTPGVRLLALDSDMIVNASVRPLFELNLLGNYIGAIHDTPRFDDPDYFNSGMMVIDIDGFHRYDVAQRSLRWLADQQSRPRWPDQDALNNIVGHRWYRLEREWNLAFCGGDFDPEGITPAYYENAKIAHFTGQTKPWNSFDHVGRPLYERYLAELQWQKRLYNAVTRNADTNFMVTAFEVFLGRQPRSGDEVRQYTRQPALAAVRALLHSEEFLAGALVALKLDTPFPDDSFAGAPSLRHAAWAAERLPVRNVQALETAQSSTWRSLLLILLDDAFFCDAFRLQPLVSMIGSIESRLTTAH